VETERRKPGAAVGGKGLGSKNRIGEKKCKVYRAWASKGEETITRGAASQRGNTGSVRFDRSSGLFGGVLKKEKKNVTTKRGVWASRQRILSKR